jgi:DNA polymerase-3 subunit gamma/tau
LDYQVSARKYRPGTFADVIGQPHVVQTLTNAITSGRIAHAFLFSGSRGVGKTTVARILAKALNCEQGPTPTPCNACLTCEEITNGTSVDVIEIDGASNTSVDDVREIRENVKFTPFRGKYRVYIIDEVHMLSNSAFNALLKTLEEPPQHVVFIFATTEIHKIPATILSRCQHYNFRRISRTEIVQRLRHVASQDGLGVEDRSLTALARACEGSMRDALSLLDQAVAFAGKQVTLADVELLLGSVPEEHVRAMIEAVKTQDSRAALRVVAQVLDQGHDLRAYAADLVECFRNLLVASVVTAPGELRGLIEASEENIDQCVADAKAFTPEQLQELFRIFTQAEDSLRFTAHPRFAMETAVVRATRVSLPKDQEPSRQPPAKPASPSAQPLPAASRARTETPPAVSLGRKSATAPAPAPASPRALVETAPVQPAEEPNESAASPVPPGPSSPASVHQEAKNPSAAESAPVNGPSSGPVSPPIELDWDRFQEEVASAHPNIAPFLEMGRPVGIEGDQLTIGFAQRATVARAMLEKDENLRAVTALCHRVSGRPLRIRIVELTEKDPPGPTMAERRQAREQEQRLVLFQQARAHPLVKQAIELFGGDLADVRQRTSQLEDQE